MEEMDIKPVIKEENSPSEISYSNQPHGSSIKQESKTYNKNIKYELDDFMTCAGTPSVEDNTIFENTPDIKEELHSDDDSVNVLESILEISKTEYTHEDTIVNTARRFDDHSDATEETSACTKDNIKRSKSAHKKQKLDPSGKHCADDKCAICKQEFEYQHELIRHAKLYHPNAKAFKCRDCDACFKNTVSVAHHRVVHKNIPKAYYCEFCSKTFYTNSKLKIHLRVHTGERPYVCSFCGKTFKHTMDLKNHKNEHWDQMETNECLNSDNKCAVCEETFELQLELIKHVKLQHPNVKALKCKICANLFLDMESVSSHRCRKTTICEYCSIDFDTIQNLNIHLKVHMGERPFLCTYCDKTYKNKRDWSHHRKTHKGQLVKECSKPLENKSKKNYPQKVNIESKSNKKIPKKLKTNTLLKPLEKLPQYNDLKIVSEGCVKSLKERRMEMDINNLMCNLPMKHHCEFCPKSFDLLSHLKCHLRVHTGKRHYSCLQSIC